MARQRILALILAGGTGGRMDVLTRERAKPTLPFAGVYQLIDFPLSNLHHSGIDDVWLSVQYQPHSLSDVVANGRPWDMDRSRGGFEVLVPQEGVGGDEDGFARGNADVLYRVRDQIRAYAPEILVVLSADHVYRFDLLDAVRTHQDKQAECTVVTADLGVEQACQDATVEANRLHRVTRTAYKPSNPTTGVVATEIFLYDPGALVAALEDLHARLTGGAEQGDTGLGDFGEHLLPELVARGRCFEHRMVGYWRDVGRPEAYFAAHRDVLDGKTDLFDAPDWPILTRAPQGPPARVRDGAVVQDSLLGPGCDVAGRVRRSVLGPGVRVAAGALVTDSILYAGATVESEATVQWSVLDENARIGDGAKVGEAPDGPLPRTDELVLVGKDSLVKPSVRIARGARLEPGTVA